MIRFPRRPEDVSPGVAALHVFALVSFGVAQPLFDLLGRSGGFFVAAQSGPLDVLALVVVLILLLPLSLVVLEWLAGLVASAWRRSVHTTIVGCLVALTFLPILSRHWSVPGTRVLFVAGLLGATGALLYRRFSAVRLLASTLALSIPIVTGNFLINTDARRVLFPTSVAAPTSARVSADTPVVLLIFDELPLASLLDEELHIDADRYPNFARLASGAYWFRNATSVADGTQSAVPSILTGRYPKKGLLPIASDHPDNIFTLFAGSYRIATNERVTRLCPRNVCTNEPERPHRLKAFLSDAGVVLGHVLLPQDLAARHLPPISQAWAGFTAAVAMPANSPESEAARIAERPELNVTFPSDSRALYVLHFLLPHVPWCFLPDGHQYDRRTPAPGLGFGERWGADERAVVQSYQRHLLQVGYVDYVLGDIIRKLKEAGIYDRALLVVAADHGCAFAVNQNRRIMTEATWPDLLRVPLFIKLPGQSAGVLSDSPVQTIDILPTIASALDVTLPFGVDGRPLLPDRGGSPARTGYDYFFTPFKVPSNLVGLREAVARKVNLFGAGADTRRLFGLGPSWRIVGRRLDEMPLSAPADLTGVLDGPERFVDVRPSTGVVPALVSGHIAGALRGQDSHAAIAINNVVRAVVPLFASGESATFSAVVSGRSFHPGRNEVTVSVIGEEGEDARLARVRLATGSYRLSAPDGIEILESPFGQSMPLRRGALPGAAEEATKTSMWGYLTIRGWVTDPAHADPPAVVAFANGRALGTATPSVDRPDIVAKTGDRSALRSGYVIRIPMEDLSDVRSIRLIGVSARGVASELTYSSEFSYRPALPSYRLVRFEGGERLEAPHAEPVPLRAHVVEGYVDSWSKAARGVLQITGWAADRSGGRSMTVLVFADGRLVATARPASDRPDVVSYFKDPGMLQSGYLVSIPADVSLATVRVIGLVDNGPASELSYNPQFPHRGSRDKR